MHGRTRKQKSTEPVNFEGIKLMKESVSMPVFANGSIFSNADAEEMYEKTGVDGVMSARGLLQNPAFFSGYEYTPWECIEVCNNKNSMSDSVLLMFFYRNMFIWLSAMVPIISFSITI